MSQSRTLLSSPPDARSLPSGLNAKENTQSVWPLRTAVSLPVATSHTRTTLSPPAEASSFPSGLTVRDLTLPVCPTVSRVASSLGCSSDSAETGSSAREATIQHDVRRHALDARDFIVRLP